MDKFAEGPGTAASGEERQSNAASPRDPDEWAGQWIGPDTVDPVVKKGLGEAAGRHESFGRVLFRKSLHLARKPSAAPLRVTADSQYVLFVNGEEVGRGPERSQPRRHRYDQWDISAQLIEGENVLAILVTFFGTANAIWQPAVPSGKLGAGPALLVDGSIDGVSVMSDSSWRSRRCDAWSTFPREDLDGMPAVCLDARLLPNDWTGIGFNDEDWPRAQPVSAGHRMASGRSVPPLAPFGRLLPRTMPSMHPRLRHPDTLSAGVVQPIAGHDARHPAAVATAALALESLDALCLEEDGSVSAVSGTIRVHADFGRVVSGLLEFDLEAPRGTVVDFAFHERKPGDDSSLPSRAGGRYIARGSHDRFSATERAGMRAVTLLVQPTSPGTVRLRSLRLRELVQPWEAGPFFRSDDPGLDDLWRAGIRTVELNTTDAFTDCPTREQRAWVGDGVVHQAVHLVANSDWSAARSYVESSGSPRDDGLLPMSIAGDIEAAGGVTIPSWSLHWIHGLHTLFRYAGLVPEVERGLARARCVLDWFVPHLDSRHILCDVPEWNLLDWSSIVTGGRSAALTALWVRGLREYAEICEFIEDRGAAAWARKHAGAAAIAFEDFWDPARGLYADAIIDGMDLVPASQATNAAAIVAGLAPEDRWNGIIDLISDPDLLVVRSWLGAPRGGLDPEKWKRVSAGEWVLDWDVEAQIVRAEPFLSYLVHDAYAAAGRYRELHRALKDWQVFLVDGFDTFGECWDWGSPCHGWSSTPTKDIARYVLGVTPEEPGFTRARVAPRPEGIERISGSVPTGHGLLNVNLAGRLVQIITPVPAVFLPTDGPAAMLPPGTHTRDLLTGAQLQSAAIGDGIARTSSSVGQQGRDGS